MVMTGSQLWDYILNLFWHFGSLTEGRPLHPGLIYLFSFVGGKLCGLNGVYWIGYLILTLNSFLIYTLLKRISTDEVFSFTGTLAFSLFPAYLNRIWLTSSLGHQPSLTFLLLAFYCYVYTRINLSYFVILGSLLCYETVFPLFLAAPLLKEKWNSKLIKELCRHVAILGAIFVSVVIIRQLTGERRVANLDLFSTITLAVQQMLIGPFVSMGTLFYRPFEIWENLSGELIVSICVGFAGIFWMLSRMKFDSRICRQKIAKLASIGLIMLALSYSLTFTVPVDITFGGGTRVHLGSTVGGAIICGCVCSAISSVANIYRKKRLATVGLAAFFASLIGFGVVVQQDYSLMWQYQRAFWTDAIKLYPDVSEGTLILVDRSQNLKTPKFISPEDWTGTSILNQIHQFPKNWKVAPSLYKLRPGWQENILSNKNLFQLKDLGLVLAKRDRDHQFESSSIIFLEAKDGKLTRRTEPLRIDGQEFTLKPKSASGLPPFPKGILYDYLIESAEEKSIKYID